MRRMRCAPFLNSPAKDGVTESARPTVATPSLRDLTPCVRSDAFRLAGKLLPMIGGEPQGTNLERSQTFHVPGENPFDVSRRLYSAIEIACLDLIGKSLGQPYAVCSAAGPRCGSLLRL